MFRSAHRIAIVALALMITIAFVLSSALKPSHAADHAADDPFFFDIVGFNRFVASVLAKNPNTDLLKRNRDSFAGYNIHMIALSLPASMLRGRAGNIIGVSSVTLHRKSHRESGEEFGEGESTKKLIKVDRMATPALSTVFIPFSRKDEYNAASPMDDAAGQFAGDIVANLMALGTNKANIDILAGVAVVKGDYLRLDLSKVNTKLGEGENVTTFGYTGFPNGRRPGDDTINSLIYFVTNQSDIREAVNKNDVPLGTAFPFFAPPHQPLENPAVDGTQN